jgi:transposase-like protein
MMPIELSAPCYTSEKAAIAHLATERWPSGKPDACPRCGVVGESRALDGKSMGPGWYYCEACQDKFTVRTGTVYERSHIPLHKWLLAFRLMSSSKKGISAHQLARTLNITYKSAWFLGHRIREAMSDTDPAPLGGPGKTIEADETFIGKAEKGSAEFINGIGWVVDSARGGNSKMKVLTVVERGGKARSVKVNSIRASDLRPHLVTKADRKSRLVTDDAGHYKGIGREFAAHESVNHSDYEWVRGDVHSNTVENYFSVFKRGMRGTYQHCGEAHLQRYLHEFDFRYSNRAALDVDDCERTTRAIKGAEGKRLQYRQPNRAKVA